MPGQAMVKVSFLYVVMNDTSNALWHADIQWHSVIWAHACAPRLVTMWEPEQDKH